MKRVAFSFTIFLVSLFALGSATIPSRRLWFYFMHAQQSYTNYFDQSNYCYNVYSTTNLGTPMTNWPLFVTITNWSLGPNDVWCNAPVQWYTSQVFIVSAAQYFVYLTASNSSGESLPSNFDFSSPIATQPGNIRVNVTK